MNTVNRIETGENPQPAPLFIAPKINISEMKQDDNMPCHHVGKKTNDQCKRLNDKYT